MLPPAPSTLLRSSNHCIYDGDDFGHEGEERERGGNGWEWEEEELLVALFISYEFAACDFLGRRNGRKKKEMKSCHVTRACGN